jgi:hypothetical protein
MTSFSSDKKTLFVTLQDVHKGKIQLPNFQRGWICLTKINWLLIYVIRSEVLSKWRKND